MTDSIPSTSVLEEAVGRLTANLGIYAAEDAEGRSLMLKDLRLVLSTLAAQSVLLREAAAGLRACDTRRRQLEDRGLGGFGASAADVDYRRGLDGMVEALLARINALTEKETNDAQR